MPEDPTSQNIPSNWLSRVRLRSESVLAVSLAGLLLLIVISLVAAGRKAQDVYTQLDEVNMMHRHVEAKLRRLRSDIHLSGIFIRDYLLDNSHLTGQYYRDRLGELRAATTATIAELERSAGPSQSKRIDGLRIRLDDYWQAFDPLFDWTPNEKMAFSSPFLRKEVLPRRDAVLVIAQDIEEVNNANMAEQRSAVALRERGLHDYLNRMLVFSLVAGILVSCAAIYRIRVLSRRSGQQQQRAELAEMEMRRLSHQLVRAQEEERRSLSRELHDEVGQMLTGLRMELGNVERATAQPGEAMRANLEECKHLVDTLIHSVRHLSMGLRPSMLDDFGLGPALEWQARDFSRRYAVPVNVTLEGDLDALCEPYRTAVYRMVQEALTNCARHAQASQIAITVRGSGQRLLVLIHDDGVGLNGSDRRSGGLGLLGIKERVRELGGGVALYSHDGAGTTVRIDLPLDQARMEENAADTRG